MDVSYRDCHIIVMGLNPSLKVDNLLIGVVFKLMKVYNHTGQIVSW